MSKRNKAKQNKFNRSNTTRPRQQVKALSGKPKLLRDLKLLNQFIKRDRNNYLVYRERGKIYVQLQRYDLAIEDYTEAIRRNLRDHTTYIQRAEVYRKQGREDLAKEDVSQALLIRKNVLPNHQEHLRDVTKQEVDWQILPLGWWRDPKRRRLVESQLNNEEQVQLFLERLEYLETFSPKEIYRSKFNDQTSPYYAFVFTECVVAENPLEGNAIYVIAGIESWQKLLRLSKEALRQQYGHRIKRIVHRGDWKARLQEAILN